MIINLTDSGNDVIATAEGSINTTALTDNLGGFNFSPAGGLADFGAAANASRGFAMEGGIYTLFGGPTFAGPAYPFSETTDPFASESGDLVGLGFTQNFGGSEGVLLPSAYVSGTIISSTGTWSLTEFSDLGVSDGDSFTWSWGSGADSDFLTINVGSAAAVPEPSPLALLSIGVFVAGMSAARRHRFKAKRQATV
jgi:hypothetical protein